MVPKTIIITGITGQDGAYLARLLLRQNYQVIGLTRSLNSANLTGLTYLGIKEQVQVLECDLSDISQVIKVITQYRPAQIYNLAAQSSVSLSFEQPIATMQFNILSVINLLEAIKMCDPAIKFYQASSSEMFGKVLQLPITEETTFHPKSPYAISKAAAHWTCVNYRESYGLFICCGILFNHESYLRNNNFFFKKVIRDALRIKKGELQTLKVGNLDVKRDFGYAPKYVEAMYSMLMQDEPGNFLICSGQSVSLREIVHDVFEKLEIDTGKIVVDPALFRPTEIEDIYGSNKKVSELLGWAYNWDYKKLVDVLLQEEMQQY